MTFDPTRERWMMQAIIAEMWEDLTDYAQRLWVESAEKDWDEEALLVAEILQAHKEDSDE